jgi:L,D-peptidoglycan transpeptidase YkuD (ErfK/YbiS/YcfS/YnhG family)
VIFIYRRCIADITIGVVRLKQAFNGRAAAGKSAFPMRSAAKNKYWEE